MQNVDTWPSKDQAYLHTTGTAPPDNLDSVVTATTVVAELELDQLLSEGPETKFKLALPNDQTADKTCGTDNRIRCPTGQDVGQGITQSEHVLGHGAGQVI